MAFSLSAAALDVLKHSFDMQIRCEAWLGGELLTADVPVASGSESRDRSLTVPERITLSVPRRDMGTKWEPILPDDPLAAYGQQLRIGYGLNIGGGNWEWIDRGFFVITESEANGDEVSVTCEGLLTLINEAKFVGAFQPSGTLGSTVRSLVEPALAVQIDAGLTDRSVPNGLTWDDDRMGALQEVMTAWPAACRVDETGLLLVEPVSDGTGSPTLTLSQDRLTGNVKEWTGSTTRDGAFNAVVCQGEDSGGNQIFGVAYDTDGNSPFQIGGNFNFLPVPFFFQSPLMTTTAQCRTAAATRLTTLRRTASRRIKAVCVPHPGIQTGDILQLVGDDWGATGTNVSVESFELPYNPGEMSLTLRVIGPGA